MVFHSGVVNPLIVFDADGFGLGPVGQEEIHPALSAAVVQKAVSGGDETAVGQPLQNGIGGGLVGVVMQIGPQLIPPAGLNL